MKTTFALGYFNQNIVNKETKDVLELWGYVAVSQKIIDDAMQRIRKEGSRVPYIDPKGRVNQSARKRFLFDGGDFVEFYPMRTFSPARNGSEIEIHSLTKKGLKKIVEKYGLPFVKDKVYH
jgi:hypothetical protein